MMTKTSALAVVLLSTLGHVAHAAPDRGDDTLATHARAGESRQADDADESGKTSIDLRYRYEYVADDATTFAAQASTLRASLGYRTRAFHGFSVLGQLAAVGAIGPDFYRVPTSPTQNNMAYPTVVDPTGLMVDQAYAQYEASWLTARLGRQELAFNNTRFLSTTPWRQVHQTFDAASVVVKPTEGVSIQYALTGRVNRVTGREASDGQLLMLGHLINATYTRQGVGSLAVYDLHLDYLEDSTSSTNTLGARASGPLRIDDEWSFLYAAELAHQTDAGQNPNHFAANYYLAEAGASSRGISGRVQYNVRQGSGPTDKLSTPLSHPWDGWTEKFATTPDSGLRTWSLALASAVPTVRGLSVSTTYYDYGSQTTKAHYGSELDAGVEYRLFGIDEHWTAGSHVSFYKADKLLTDTLRMSAYTAYNF